jgi:lauroyl/myristoyl acyltransferase
VVAEFPLLDRICGPEAANRLEIVPRHDLAPARTGARLAMFVTAHLSNSELAVTAATRNGVPLSIVSTPQSNAVVQTRLERFRRMLGCRYIPSRGGLRQLLREVADGRSLGWITDQRNQRGEMLPFFGVGAATATMPALLALRLKCDLVPGRVERLSGCRFRITIYESLSPAGLEHLPQHEAARELTRRLNALFEQWITERPGQWLCFKRRWGKGAQPPDRPMRRVDESSPTGLADVAPALTFLSARSGLPHCMGMKPARSRGSTGRSRSDPLHLPQSRSRPGREHGGAVASSRPLPWAELLSAVKHPTKPAIVIWESHRAKPPTDRAGACAC